MKLFVNDLLLGVGRNSLSRKLLVGEVMKASFFYPLNEQHMVQGPSAPTDSGSVCTR